MDKVVIEDWQMLYNEVRHHSSLGAMTPKLTRTSRLQMEEAGLFCWD
ncbi:integrase core domain-containing protein [Fundidesulfovibrio magnetotacticus]